MCNNVHLYIGPPFWFYPQPWNECWLGWMRVWTNTQTKLYFFTPTI